MTHLTEKEENIGLTRMLGWWWLLNFIRKESAIKEVAFIYEGQAELQTGKLGNYPRTIGVHEL